MVFLALDSKAALEAIALARLSGAAVWVGSDAMSHDEHYRIASEGVNLTRFEYSLSGVDTATVEDALATVREHNPGETVWLQQASVWPKANR
jgi:hypothetical protein